MTRIIASDSSAKKILVRRDEREKVFKVAVLSSSPSSMNSNTAVFGICNPESSYGSSQSYSATSEHLSAFYGSQAASGGSGGDKIIIPPCSAFFGLPRLRDPKKLKKSYVSRVLDP